MPLKISNPSSVLQQVIDADMCIACGACIESCPKGLIYPSYNNFRGAHEVIIENSYTCNDCTKICELVCPSVSVNYIPYEGNVNTERLGKVVSAYIAYSDKFRFNGVSSSGGVVREIIYQYLLQEIPVICLVGNDGHYRAGLVRSVNDLNEMPGSIYHSVSFVDAIKLIKSVEYKCVLVAIPCVLEGIQKYILHKDPSLNNKIEMTIGLICGWMYSDHSWKSFSKFKKIKSKIRDIRYRGEDKVGFLKLKTESNKYEYTRRDFEFFKDEIDFKTSYSGIFNRLRCRTCQNHTNISADISVGDAWLDRYSDPQEKVSIIVSRTDQGDNTIGRLGISGCLNIKSATLKDIIESQSEDLIFGVNAQKMVLYLKGNKIIAPQYIYSRIDNVILSAKKKIEFKHEFVWRSITRRQYYFLFRIMITLRYLPRELNKFFKKIFVD